MKGQIFDCLLHFVVFGANILIIGLNLDKYQKLTQQNTDIKQPFEASIAFNVAILVNRMMRMQMLSCMVKETRQCLTYVEFGLYMGLWIFAV